MKKFCIIAALLDLLLSAYSQNIQYHYDFGEGRHYSTLTFEMFKPDSLGSTFFFIDYDFDYPGNPRGVSLSYFELSRDFYIPGIKKVKGLGELTLHIEYNDGILVFQDTANVDYGTNLTSVFLTGLGYPVKIGPVVLGTMFLYRQARRGKSPDFQFTTVWYQAFLKDRLQFTGFLDIWSQDAGSDKELVFQAEPQLWYNIFRKLYLGGELEISKNFEYDTDKWVAMPTLGMKVEF